MPHIIPPFTLPTDRGYKFLRVFEQYYMGPGGRLVLWVEGGIADYTWALDAASEIEYSLDPDDISATENEAGQDADKLVDDDITGTSYWEKLSFSAPMIKYDFGENSGAILNKYKLSAGDAQNTRMPSDWTFQGSNNDSDWDTLDTQTGITFNASETKTYTFTNVTKYRYYRLNITDSTDGTDVRMYELEFLGDDYVLDEVTTTVQYNFINASPQITVDTTIDVNITDDNSEEATIKCCTCSAVDCCADPGYAFTWTVYPGGTTLQPGGSVTLILSGGCPPYHWTLDDEDNFSLAQGYTNTPSNTLTAESDAPEGTIVTITVEDSCGNNPETVIAFGNDEVIGGQIGVDSDPGPCTGEYLYYWDSGNPTEFDPCQEGESLEMELVGGTPMFFWQSHATGFFLDSGYTLNSENTMSRLHDIYINDDACDETGEITALDGCLQYPMHPGDATWELECLCCCDDPGYTAPTWDTGSTPREAVANDFIDVYIQDGCPPYSWAFVGTPTGWTILDAQTNGLTNEIHLDAAGFDCSAIVRVTDDCSNTTDFEFFAPGGSWSNVDSAVARRFTTSCASCGTSVPCSPQPADIFEYLETGAQRWRITNFRSVFYQGACNFWCESGGGLADPTPSGLPFDYQGSTCHAPYGPSIPVDAFLQTYSGC